jgi:hypothetical protein
VLDVHGRAGSVVLAHRLNRLRVVEQAAVGVEDLGWIPAGFDTQADPGADVKVEERLRSLPMRRSGSGAGRARNAQCQ